MNTVDANAIDYLGTFEPYTPDPLPAGAPFGAVFFCTEHGTDLRDALSWGGAPSGDTYVAIDATNTVRMSLLDAGADQFGNPDRTMLRPFIEGLVLRVFRVRGLPDRAVHGGYMWWRWDGERTFREPITRTIVTRAQAKIALLRAGLLDRAKAAVAAAGGEAQVWFDEATAWESDNPYVAQIGAALGLSEEEVGALFASAREIVA